MLKPSKKKSQIEPLPRVLVIVGPTTSGKTSMGVKLAKKFNGEVVSADSRQIYRGLDIGTAKPTLKEQQAIPHHLIDVKYPNQSYTAAEYKKDCLKAIRQILKKNKLPIIVGGTGFYIRAVVDNLTIPKVEADPLLRKELEQEYKWMTKYFKEPIAYCPSSGRLTDESGREASELGVRKVITTGLISVGAFRDKGDSWIEIVTVAPLHRIGFGPYRFIHLDKVPDYRREIEAHVQKGLQKITDIKREGWFVYRARDSVKKAVNDLVHKCLPSHD